eukprot:SAG31_NODE_1442_length_8325_cov_5.564916_1_plen_113_part_00
MLPPPTVSRESSSQQMPRLPVWWLLLQQSFWHPQFFTFLLCMNVLVPFRVLDLVGETQKAESLALTQVRLRCQRFLFCQTCSALFGADAMAKKVISLRAAYCCGSFLFFILI